MDSLIQGQDEKLLLEICYPTFSREETCIKNVLNIIKCSDPRYAVYVSSNGPGPKIHEALGSRKNVRINEFDVNQGFSSNVEYLLETSKAKYALLLSDEDTINEAELIKLLDFLQAPETVEAVYYLSTQTSYSLGTLQQFSGKYLDLGNLMLTHPMNPTYMSGYIFPTSDCKKANIRVLFDGGIENAYPFLKLRNKILKDGRKFMLIPEITIIQGPSINVGGASLIDFYSLESRTMQYMDFTSIKQEHVPRQKHLRFVSKILIAKQIQNNMGLKVYFHPIRYQFFEKREWSIAFVANITIQNLFAIISSQILIKIIQKFSGLYRLLLSRGSWRSTS